MLILNLHSRFPRFIAQTLVLASMSPLTTPLWGWGNEGHRAVALVAEELLATNVKANATIKSLIGGLTLHDLATCADEVRTLEREPAFTMSPACKQVFPKPLAGTSHWHFINLDVASPDPNDAAIDTICANDCAVAKILSFFNTLQNASASQADRKQALAFLVHFIGDIHQPLHAAQRGNDEGGNKVIVDFLVSPNGPTHQPGTQEKLHAVWDSGILDVIAANETVFVSLIGPQVAAAQTESVPSSLTVWVHAWARQSLDLARSVAYKGVNPPPKPLLGADYEKAAGPVVRNQIARGGFRLAQVLSQALK